MKNQIHTLITGASRGIGQEVATQLCARGQHVVVGARDKAAGEKTVAALKKSGGEASFLHLDVADEASINLAAQILKDTLPRLDVLINNAAILLDESTPLLDLAGETLMLTLRTNTLGPLRIAQTCMPLLRLSKAPRIVNVSSGAGSLTLMNHWAPAYSISKTALNAVTRQLASVLSGKGVAVNSVCPGWVRTRMGGKSAPKSIEQGAETIVWLASDAPQSFTGKFFGDGKREIAW